jgi:sulfopyruvate decarboxylase subunit beta
MAVKSYDERIKDYECYKTLAALVEEDTLVVGGVQMTGHIWSSVRPSEANLLDVNMGLEIPTALGLALALPHRKVVCIVGDGSAMFGMGNLVQISWVSANNLTIFIMDNSCYVGFTEYPSPTLAITDLETVARGAGIRNTKTVWTIEEFEEVARNVLNKNELSVTVSKIRWTPFPRPADFKDGNENKYVFVRYIERTEKMRILRPYGFPSKEYNMIGVADEDKT